MVNAEEAVRVRRIFSLYLELGSLLPVVEELERRGVVQQGVDNEEEGWNAGAGRSTRCSVYQLLTNPIYIGKIKHKADVYDGEHEPIIDAARVRAGPDQAPAERTRAWQPPDQQVRRAAQGAAALPGLWPHDGPHVHGPGIQTLPLLHLLQAIKSGRKACPTKSLPAAEIEAAVVDQIRCIAHDAHLRDRGIAAGSLGGR